MFIDRTIATRGSELLGTGGFAAVVADPQDPSRVLKFGLDPDDAWPAWAQFSRERQSRYTPVVHRFRWVLNSRGQRVLYVAELERLRPWQGAEHAEVRGLLGSSKLRQNAALLADAIGEVDFPLATFLYSVRTAFPNGIHDLKPDNWMIRPSDGSIVLADPLSYRARVGSTKEISL